MSDETRQEKSSVESTVDGAAKTGKAIANIAKGAAVGGAHGAAVEAGKASKKWIAAVIVALIALPIVIVAMLPSVIFGSLLGDGTDTPNGISDDAALIQNMTDINNGISMILSEGLTDVLDRIEADFAASGCDGKEINNPFGSDVVFNANAFVSQYPRAENDAYTLYVEIGEYLAPLRMTEYSLIDHCGYLAATEELYGGKDKRSEYFNQLRVSGPNWEQATSAAIALENERIQQLGSDPTRQVDYIKSIMDQHVST